MVRLNSNPSSPSRFDEPDGPCRNATSPPRCDLRAGGKWADGPDRRPGTCPTRSGSVAALVEKSRYVPTIDGGEAVPVFKRRQLPTMCRPRGADDRSAACQGLSGGPALSSGAGWVLPPVQSEYPASGRPGQASAVPVESIDAGLLTSIDRGSVCHRRHRTMASCSNRPSIFDPPWPVRPPGGVIGP